MPVISGLLRVNNVSYTILRYYLAMKRLIMSETLLGGGRVFYKHAVATKQVLEVNNGLHRVVTIYKCTNRESRKLAWINFKAIISYCHLLSKSVSGTTKYFEYFPNC